ncbi:hypothetical protein OG417_40600 [Actinoallomurus sp. NBC_01490]|uniref:hypothetical protein n=1 Tax=Actinoallomurus sp. NBC_01490 TaxID=2903557 RepID=UPI002E36EFD3|nr:hypothetical protein [Actinoallomurus sp. NBC_01490]
MELNGERADPFRAFFDGDALTPVERALLTAALDVRRLGHDAPIPESLLVAAVDGYLSERVALPVVTDAAAALERLGALTVVGASESTERRYEPDPDLDRYARGHRQEVLGPASLWDALATHTTGPEDLYRLGKAARRRGLYRHTAMLWRRAVETGGSARTARDLLRFIRRLGADEARVAGRWPAGQVALGNPADVGYLLDALCEAGAEEAVRLLLDRDPAGRVDMDWAAGLATLLEALKKAGADDQVARLPARGLAERVYLDDAYSAGCLLKALRAVGASEAIAAVARRMAVEVSCDSTWMAGDLLAELRKAGASEAAVAVADRMAADVALEIGHDGPRQVHEHADIHSLLSEMRACGAEGAAEILVDRIVADVADDPRTISGLLDLIDPAYADTWFEPITKTDDGLARALFGRHEHYPLDDPRALRRVMGDMTIAKDDRAALVRRAVREAPLRTPRPSRTCWKRPVCSGTTRPWRPCWPAIRRAG